MKKLITLVGIIILIFALSGCSNTTSNKTSKMSIEKAKLTEEEENLLNLVGVHNPNMIYDYNLDDEIQSIKISVYELKGREWVSTGREIINTEDQSGRLTFSFDKIGEGYRIANQNESSNSSSVHNSETTIDSSGVGTAFLDEKKDIEYEKEIPIVTQLLTSKDSWNTYTQDSFFTPEMYEADDYDDVYAITLMFSKKNANELSK